MILNHELQTLKTDSDNPSEIDHFLATLLGISQEELSEPDEVIKISDEDLGLEDVSYDVQELSDAPGALNTFSLFFLCITAPSLLSHEQEISVGQRMLKGRLEKISGELNEEELEKIVADAALARTQLIRANGRLVVHIAKKYLAQGISFPDLVQEGYLGLLRAVDKFEPELGFRFSTYAWQWITLTVTDAIQHRDKILTTSTHIKRLIHKVNWTEEKLLQEKKKKPTAMQVALRMLTTQKKPKLSAKQITEQLSTLTLSVEHVLKYSNFTKSLQDPNGENISTDIEGSLVDMHQEPVEDQVMKKIYFELLENALDTLPPREAEILRLRFGLVDGIEYTKVEISNFLGVTPPRIFQLEKQALRRIRENETMSEILDMMS